MRRFLVLLAAVFGGCSGWPPDDPCADEPIDPDPIVERANAEEAKWNAAKPAAYSMLVEKGCPLCDEAWWFSSVDGGNSTAWAVVTSRSDATLQSAEPSSEFATMADVFEKVRGVAKAEPVDMGAAYDEARHFPTSFGASFSVCASDSGVGYGVRLFDAAAETGVDVPVRCTEANLSVLGKEWRLVGGDSAHPVTAVVDAPHLQVRTYRDGEIRGRFDLTANSHGEACLLRYESGVRYRGQGVYLLVAGEERLALWSPYEKLYFARVNEQ